MKFPFESLGWPIAGLLAVGIATTGFRDPASKVGIVDVQKALRECDATKKATDKLQTAFKARQDLIEYVNTYPVMTVAQATRLKDLTLKPAPTAAETAELNTLKGTIKDLDSKLRALQLKANPTPADKQQLDDFGKRAQDLGGLIQQWRQAFNDELNQMQDEAQQANQASALAAISEVGKAQGFTLVFVRDVAPYGTNDVTADVLKSMNKKP